MNILLTDEEIRGLSQNVTLDKEALIVKGCKIVAKAQLKRLYEWGEEQCQLHHTSGIWFKRRECNKCWQALLKEVSKEAK